MSIIYDALQKTQQNRESLRQQSDFVKEKAYRLHPKAVVLMALAISLSVGAGILISSYLRPVQTAGNAKPTAAKRVVAAPVQTQALEATHLWVTEKAPQGPVKEELRLENNQEYRANSSAPIIAQNTVEEPKDLQSQASLPASAEVPAYMNKLTLNGVLISDQEKTALINNQAFHVGDMVDGMRIVTIEFNRVRLQTGQDLLELRVPV